MSTGGIRSTQNSVTEHIVCREQYIQLIWGTYPKLVLVIERDRFTWFSNTYYIEVSMAMMISQRMELYTCICTRRCVPYEVNMRIYMCMREGVLYWKGSSTPHCFCSASKTNMPGTIAIGVHETWWTGFIHTVYNSSTTWSLPNFFVCELHVTRK